MNKGESLTKRELGLSSRRNLRPHRVVRECKLPQVKGWKGCALLVKGIFQHAEPTHGAKLAAACPNSHTPRRLQRGQFDVPIL